MRLLAVVLCALTVSACSDSQRYQLVRADDNIVVRLDTRTGDLEAFMLGKDYTIDGAKEMELRFGVIARYSGK